MTAPWTPRERRMREALEKVRELGGNWMTQDEVWPIVNTALANQPPPDPRDEALRLAEIALNLSPGRVDLRLMIMTGGSEPSEEMSGHIEAYGAAKFAALAAIAAAKGEKG